MSSIIEFNGKKYDSLTGRVLASEPDDNSDALEVKKIFKPAAHNIDGVNHRPKKIEIKSEAPVNTLTKKPAKTTRHSIARKRKIEKSKTLMRTAVKKSKHKPASEHKAPVRIELYKELKRERARRARHIEKSSLVKKFSKSTHQKSTVKTNTTFKSESIPVAAPPTSKPYSIAEEARTQAHKFSGKLDQAIQSAESHLEVFTEEKLSSKKSRKFAYALASLTSVFLIGFAVYQYIPFVQVKMASSKAGFSASLPEYAPVGYELDNKLQSDSGVVTMTYNSSSDNKSYKITQTPSQWNSDSLLNNFVLTTSSQYERIEENGRIIYVYDNDQSATWLDNGIWYTLEGADNFSKDQLVRIVNGL